jgi:branched-chain amino acid transport system ATP-binding protein
MLILNNIHSYYGQIHALKGVSLEVKQGSICCLIGANGAGKSTTLMSISGIHPIASGRIEFQGKAIQDRAPEEIVQQGIVHVPEGRRIFPFLTVQENLLLGAYLRNDKLEIKSSLEQAFSLFPILKERRKQAGGTLSGGEQQMLAIARGLMSRPKLLLLDEPSLGLAPLIVEHIMGIIRRFSVQQGVTILVVEQNAQAALDLADYGYVMETGQVVLKDRAERLLENQKVREAYLGE